MIPLKILPIRRMLRARAASPIMILTRLLEDPPAYLRRFHLLQVLQDQSLQVFTKPLYRKEYNTDIWIQLFDLKIRLFSQSTKLYP